MRKVRETPEFYFEELDKEQKPGEHGEIYSALKATNDADNAGRIGLICYALSLFLTVVPFVYKGRVNWQRAGILAFTTLLLAIISRWGQRNDLKTRIGQKISTLEGMYGLLLSMMASSAAIMTVSSLIFNPASEEFSWREKLMKFLVGIAGFCGITISYSIAQIVDFRKHLQKGAIYGASSLMVFFGFAMISYAEDIQPRDALANTLTTLGYVVIGHATLNILVLYFMARRSIWILMFTSWALLLVLTVTSCILMCDTVTGTMEQSAPNPTTISTKYVATPYLQNCVNDLLRSPSKQLDILCQTALWDASKSPSKSYLVWSITAIVSTTFTALLFFKLAKDPIRPSQAFIRVGVMDIFMTIFFMIAFFSGYAYFKNVETTGGNQSVSFSSAVTKMLPGLSHAQNNQQDQLSVSSWMVSSNTGSYQQAFDTSTYSSQNLGNNTTVEKKITRHVTKSSTEGETEIITSEDRYTYPNKSVVTYTNITTTTKPISGKRDVKTTQSLTIKNEDGTVNTYTLEPLPTRRRILLQMVPQSHQQASSGNYLWIACFTGFGQVSMININQITNDLPTMAKCVERIKNEKSDFTVEKLRDAVEKLNKESSSVS